MVCLQKDNASKYVITVFDISNIIAYIRSKVLKFVFGIKSSSITPQIVRNYFK